MWFLGKKKKENKKEEKVEKTSTIARDDVKDKKENKLEQKCSSNKKEPSLSASKKCDKTISRDKDEVKGKKAIYRVVYDKETKTWKIKKDGAKRVIDSKHTKEEALARVEELSQTYDIKYVVHKKDGKFQKK